MTTRRLRRQIAIAALAVPAAVITVSTGVASAYAQPAEPPQPFAESSPFRTPIPVDAEVDPNSAAMIDAVSWDDSANAQTVEYGIPIYTADANTPRHSVQCIIAEWGRCPFDGLQVPIPDGARPQDGSDGAMVVIDPDNRKIYEFWRAQQVNGSWTTEFAAVNTLDGSGWGGASTGSGASRLAGVVRVAEIAQGWSAAGIRWDHDGMTNIPWKRLRVLK